MAGLVTDPDSALDRLCGWLICGACLRIRVSVLHGAARLFGMCPGDK
jgi:hypothetical protein